MYERRILSWHPCNVLLEGADTATDAALRSWQRNLAEPIHCHWPQAPLELPGSETRTLILRDAAALSGDDQQRLLEWSGDTGSGTQIISMTTHALFSLVAAGLFDAALYYRLNVILLRVGAPDPRLPCDGTEDVDRAPQLLAVRAVN